MTISAATFPTAGHGLHPSLSACADSLPPDRRGRLRNGARPGDFLAAPRCGTRTRCGGTCRQPAMRSGRCRLHGGLSTGPRTAEGRARCARARLTHGGYSAATRALHAEARAWTRRIRGLIAVTRPRRTAGHGVLPSFSASGIPGAAAAKGHHRVHRDRRGGRGAIARAAHNHSSSVVSVNSVVNPSTAGHGVLPPISPSRMSRRAPASSAEPHCRLPRSPLGMDSFLRFRRRASFRRNIGPAWAPVCRPGGRWCSLPPPFPMNGPPS